MSYTILSLSGGGYRGLFTAYILREIERRWEKNLIDCFDLIAGTSIGGVIACALASGVSTKKIVEIMEKRGPSVFPAHRRFIPPLFSSKYNPIGLKSQIMEMLGDCHDKCISEINKSMLVVSVSSSTSRPVIFTTKDLCTPPHEDVKILDVAMATSAAPTYFPEYRIKNENLIDGGVVANSPDLISLLTVHEKIGVEFDDINMISIGTASSQGEVKIRPPVARGIFGWLPLTKEKNNIFDISIYSQQKLAINLTRGIMGGRYVRLDRRPSPDQEKVLSMDMVGEETINTLRSLSSILLSDLQSTDWHLIDEIGRHSLGEDVPEWS